jgi:sirohydrochlorin ferrochelatase
MKLLLSLLVVANILLFGWFRGWMAPLGGDGREPERMQRQVSPDRLRPVGDGAALPAAPANVAAVSLPASDPAPVDPTDPIAIIAQLSGAPCVEIGPMSEADAVRVQLALDAVASDLQVRTLRAEDVTAWWVYIAPPVPDIARLVAELRVKGVTDLYVVPDGIWKGAVSLGHFRQEELATALQRTLAERGVGRVRVAPRGPSPGRMTLQVRPVPSAVPIELARLGAELPEAAARPCAVRA